MKSGPPDENFCTVTNNRKQNLPKNKIFQQKRNEITLFEIEIIFFFLQNFLLFTKPGITSNFSISRSTFDNAFSLDKGSN